MEQHDLIVVTPVYEDVEACSRLFKELADQFNDRLFVVAVDDGSVRQPLDVGCLEAAGVKGVVIKLKRNVGHQKAIAIGLSYVSDKIGPDQRVVVMDSDGEDMPATIPTLLEQLQRDDVDVAVAHRKSRVETWRFKLFYAIYKRVFKVMTGRPISFGNFMALKRASVKRLVAMQELPIHVAGAVLASKLRTGVCPLDRGPRYAGQSKMNFVGLVLHGFKGLMVFAEDVLVRVGIACGLIAALSVAGAGTAVALKVIGYSSRGWFSVAIGILILMFMQTGALALMTLMLTGIVRGGSTTMSSAYQDLIDEVLPTALPRRLR
ncbi:glycosyltransferase [Hydrogenophaga sp. D2P1]|uniref:Glycosyltransferase n=1 Tax=Hydrogenophaga aromaticivorans TaxID=2610898 RepID=A0A7Y8L045_9BURK|nr:glycosyltransferase [Hydrogenophaga aromaticivorans]NWF47986.1 glycosyltransferase [Hydrogenophaga aromaticivorans]